MKISSGNLLDLSADQENSLDCLMDWYLTKNKRQFITLGGFAGTGKTTLIAYLRQQLDQENKKLKVVFCSYTGRATRVLRQRLKNSGALFIQDEVSTIHGLIYSPVINERDEITGWKLKENLNCELIVIDEASMVDEQIWRDLLSFKKPIIAVGDHGQLPPIRANFNLMEFPDLKLEQIHRQAKNNPIIKLSIMARQNGNIPAGNYQNFVCKYNRQNSSTQEIIVETLNQYNQDTLILCGYNFTRLKINRYLRGVLGFNSPIPQTGDRVICLRNNHNANIFNGMLGTIEKIQTKDSDKYKVDIEMDGEEEIYSGKVLACQFDNPETINFTKNRRITKKVDLFDFGYALTVHKAQGSQAKRVVLFEEKFSRMDENMWRRWLYTAVTRAEEELIIFGN